MARKRRKYEQYEENDFEEFEPEPDPLPLAIFMRYVAYLLIIFGGTELGLGIILFTFFEDLNSGVNNPGFIGSLCVILCGIVGICSQSSAPVVVCNSLVAVAGVVVAFIIWTMTIAEYAQLDLYTNCVPVVYVPVTVNSSRLENCNNKNLDFQCICMANDDSVCDPYNIRSGAQCPTIISVYQLEVQFSIVLLMLSMLALGLYVFIVYASLFYYSKDAFVIPERIVKLKYLCFTNPNADGDAAQPGIIRFCSKVFRVFCFCCKTPKIMPIIDQEAADAEAARQTELLRLEEEGLIADEAQIEQRLKIQQQQQQQQSTKNFKTRVSFAEEKNLKVSNDEDDDSANNSSIDPLMQQLQWGQDEHYTSAKLTTYISDIKEHQRMFEMEAAEEKRQQQQQQQEEEEQQHVLVDESRLAGGDYLSKINRFVKEQDATSEVNGEDSVDDAERVIETKPIESDIEPSAEEGQHQSCILATSAKLNALTFTRHHNSSSSGSAGRGQQDDGDSHKDIAGSDMLPEKSHTPTRAIVGRPPQTPSRPPLSTAPLANQLVIVRTPSDDPSQPAATNTSVVTEAVPFISPLILHPDPVYAAAALRDYMTSIKQAVPEPRAPSEIVYTRKPPPSWSPPPKRPPGEQQEGTDFNAVAVTRKEEAQEEAMEGDVVEKDDNVVIPIQPSFYIQNQQKKVQTYLYTRF